MGLAGSQGLKSGGGTASTLAPNATGSTLALSGSSTALQFISTQVNGSDGIKFNNTGARAHFGPGTLDYIVSDGVSTLSMPAAGTFSAILKAATVANSSQLTLVDTTNSQSFFFIVNNTFASIWDNSGANEIMRWTNSGNVRVLADIAYASYTDDSATPGARTVNKARGKSAVAAGASSVVITNSFVTANSQVICMLEANDATATFIKSCVPAAGTFTLTVNANATAALKFSWIVIN